MLIAVIIEIVITKIIILIKIIITSIILKKW